MAKGIPCTYGRTHNSPNVNLSVLFHSVWCVHSHCVQTSICRIILNMRLSTENNLCLSLHHFRFTKHYSIPFHTVPWTVSLSMYDCTVYSVYCTQLRSYTISSTFFFSLGLVVLGLRSYTYIYATLYTLVVDTYKILFGPI